MSGELVIEGNTIFSTRELSRKDWLRDSSSNDTEAERVDLGSRLVTPAFVNAHTHLSLTCLRGIATNADNAGNVIEEVYYPVENNLEPGDVRAFTRIGAYESLLSGVGCVWDHYYYGNEVAEACAEVGLSAVVCPTLQDVAGPGKDHWQTQIETTIEIAEDNALATAGVVAALGPHATDTVSDDLWKLVAKTADEQGLLWHAHVSQSFEEFERSLERHGVTPVERLRRLGLLDTDAGALLVHGLYVSDADTALLDPKRHVLGYCPFSQLQFAFPLPLEPWRERGIPIIVATDCAAGNDTWNVQAELRLLAGGAAFTTTASEEHARFRRSASLDNARSVFELRQAVFAERLAWAEPQRLLDTVWSTPGALHPALPLGELGAGARANVVIWNADDPVFWPGADYLRALTTADVTHAIWGMLVSGKWIGERGSFAASLKDSAHYQASATEASKRLKFLLKRAGL